MIQYYFFLSLVLLLLSPDKNGSPDNSVIAVPSARCSWVLTHLKAAASYHYISPPTIINPDI